MPTTTSLGDNPAARSERDRPPSASLPRFQNAAPEVVIDVTTASRMPSWCNRRAAASIASCLLLVAAGVAVGIWAALDMNEEAR